MTLLFICDDSKMQLMVNGTIDDLIEPANALRELRPFTTFDSATTWLKDRPQNRPPPTAVLIDPQTGRQGAQDTRAFLNELSAKELHAVVALRAPARSSISRSAQSARLDVGHQRRHRRRKGRRSV
jgi:hypothetical protein